MGCLSQTVASCWEEKRKNQSYKVHTKGENEQQEYEAEQSSGTTAVSQLT